MNGTNANHKRSAYLYDVVGADANDVAADFCLCIKNGLIKFLEIHFYEMEFSDLRQLTLSYLEERPPNSGAKYYSKLRDMTSVKKMLYEEPFLFKYLL